MDNKKGLENVWHESKVSDCDFNVCGGYIVRATNLDHTKPKYAYDRDGYRVDGVKYSSRYEYRWC